MDLGESLISKIEELQRDVLENNEFANAIISTKDIIGEKVSEEDYRDMISLLVKESQLNILANLYNENVENYDRTEIEEISKDHMDVYSQAIVNLIILNERRKNE